MNLRKAMMTSSPDTPERMTQMLQEICDLSLTKKYPKTRRPGKMWWSKRLETLRRQFLTARRRFTRRNKTTNGEPDPDTIKMYRETYLAFKEEKDRAKSSLHYNLCNDLNDNPWGDAYRHAIAKLRPKQRAKTPPNADPIISRLFPEHETVSFVCEPPNGTILFTDEDVMDAAKRLKNGKSPGLDGIPAEVVKEAVGVATGTFTAIMNDLFLRGQFPKIWKEANLKLIPKEGHSELNPKYRPICLLNTMGKMMEHLLNQKLTQELDRVKGISDKQHAFTKKRSCSTALETVMTFMEKTRRKGTEWTPGIILLDVSNAFNSANWQVILTRMRALDINEDLVRMVHSYFSDRSLRLDDKTFHLTSGVPQGSVLGPTLWNILIDPVAQIELPDHCEVIIYADDVAILVAAKDGKSMTHRGNLAIARVVQTLELLGLKVEGSKTNAMIARGQRKGISTDTNFSIKGLTVQPSPQVKYLGVTLDSDLSFVQHAKRINSTATAALNALSSILGAENVRMARRRIIARVVEGKLLYASEVWWNRMAVSGREILESVQKRTAVRIIRGLPSTSGEAGLVLANMVPLEIQAKARRQKLYGPRLNDADILRLWQARWTDRGPSWTKTLIPDIKRWTQREQGELGSALTEMLTGHGHFGTFMKISKRRQDSQCHYCRAPETVRHLVLHCPRYDQLRTAAGLQGEVDPRGITRIMLASREGWRQVERLATRIRTDGMGTRTI